MEKLKEIYNSELLHEDIHDSAFWKTQQLKCDMLCEIDDANKTIGWQSGDDLFNTGALVNGRCTIIIDDNKENCIHLFSPTWYDIVNFVNDYNDGIHLIVEVVRILTTFDESPSMYYMTISMGS